MTKPKVLLIFGTRPEAIKLAPVLATLRAYPDLDVRTCASGQHRDLLDQVLATVDISPDVALHLMDPGQSLDRMTARLLTGLSDVLQTERPDRILVQGDTATALTGALAAFYRRIPISHVEAGLRSGNVHHPWPEEANRRMISAMADQHFAPTRGAADALRRENVDPATIHVTGNTGIDALFAIRRRLLADPALAAELNPVIDRHPGKRIVLVTMHRRENLGSGMKGICTAVTRIAEREDVVVLLPRHPNPAVTAVLTDQLAGLANVAILPPLDYPHFIRALDLSHIVLSDSGGVQEEAPALGKPCLVLRETTERPEGIAAGTARLVGTDPARIVSEISTLLDDKAAYSVMAKAHSPFGDGKAAVRIAKVVAHGFGLC